MRVLELKGKLAGLEGELAHERTTLICLQEPESPLLKEEKKDIRCPFSNGPMLCVELCAACWLHAGQGPVYLMAATLR